MYIKNILNDFELMENFIDIIHEFNYYVMTV